MVTHGKFARMLSSSSLLILNSPTIACIFLETDLYLSIQGNQWVVKDDTKFVLHAVMKYVSCILLVISYSSMATLL